MFFEGPIFIRPELHRIRGKIERAEPQVLGLFNLLSAERICEPCRMFDLLFEDPIPTYFEGLEVLFEPHAKNTFDFEILEPLLENLNGETPDSQEFGDSLSGQVRAAIETLVCAIEGLKSNPVQKGIESSDFLVYAVDCFISSTSGDSILQEKLNSNPLLERELNWQMTLLDKVQTIQIPKDLNLLRWENRNYLIPAAFI